jgi:hypothetical protein
MSTKLVFVNAHFRFCYGILKMIRAYWRRYPSRKPAPAKGHVALAQ